MAEAREILQLPWLFDTKNR